MQSTIWPVYFRAVPAAVSYWRECVRCVDGGHVTLDWLLEAGGRGDTAPAPSPPKSAAAAPASPALPPLRADSPVVIMLCGIAGGSGDTYMKHFAAMARAKGMRPVCFNSRGCANGPLTVPQFYSASFTGCDAGCGAKARHAMQCDAMLVLSFFAWRVRAVQ